MAKLYWDRPDGRYFEFGVDKGVLYPPDKPGVSWSGLISVNQSPTGGSSTPHYIDGFKFYNEPELEEFEATIEAYTYPDEFLPFDGMVYNDQGIGYDQQPRSTFGLSYRTKVGNGFDERDQIHLVYNAMATPSERSYSTVTDTTEPVIFSWSITTTPIFVQGFAPTAHIVLNLTNVKSDAVNALEDLLYGSSSSHPTLPTPDEISDFLESWEGFEVIEDRTSGISKLSPLGVDDLVGNLNDGIFTKADSSRLVATDELGIYRMDESSANI